MRVNFNSNINLLMGGSFCGGSGWNKASTEVDNCFKLYYMRKGEALLQGKLNNFLLQEGNLYFINGYSILSQKCELKMVVDWAHFLPASVYLNQILRMSKCVIPLDYSRFESFAELFKRLDRFFLQQMDDFQDQVTQLELHSLLQLVIAQTLTKLDKKLFENDEVFNRMHPSLDFITSNYTQNISLKELADLSCLSPNYFHRLFSKTFNISPLNYIRQMRMEEAVRQLVYTNNPIKEIAFNVGYDDEAYFSRIFSQTYKISPGRYRKGNEKRTP